MENLSKEFLVLWKKEETPQQNSEKDELWWEEDLWKEEELWEKEKSRERATRPQEENRDEEKRAGWKSSEMNLLTEILLLIKRKKMVELEEAYAKKLALKEAGLQGVRAQNKLLASLGKYVPDYLLFRKDWMARNPHIAFEDITKIRAMNYTSGGVPRYVYHGRPNSLQIYSVSVLSLEGPCHVFGVIAVRDSIDSQRNLIFNRGRDDSEAIIQPDQCLLITGPSRAVVMNGPGTIEADNRPLTIEAELKVKGDVESKDSYFIIQAKTLDSFSGEGYVQLTGPRGYKLRIEVGELIHCVEATIFFRVIDGTWPADVRGYFRASTTGGKFRKRLSSEIMLVQFGDGNMNHLRHVVSVQASGELVVSVNVFESSVKVFEPAMVPIQEEVIFNAEMSGRSFDTLKVGSCSVGVLVAWSRITPKRDELVRDGDLHLCHF